MSEKKEYKLRLLHPRFDSELVDVVTELEKLRNIQVRGTTPPFIFFQLKDIFHMLESLGSARIEGNHTTLADYIEIKIEQPKTMNDEIKEIYNIEQAMSYLEEHIEASVPITELLIRELHNITVTGLKREGDKTPGAYRNCPVQIAQAKHIPPEFLTVASYMRELIDFINHDDPPKYDLMKVALVHHRFSWIHPFRNGNGRVVRLLTYAMLLQKGFNLQTANRILNPTAIFCNDRNQYYKMLSIADEGTDEALEAWCLYVLKGLQVELAKFEKLASYKFVSKNILLPSILSARSKNLISEIEALVLQFGVNKVHFKSGDLKEVLPSLEPYQYTYLVKKLLQQKLIQPIEVNSRIYQLNFSNSFLIRGVINQLKELGFISDKLLLVE
jgi:Fic family protein